MTKKIIAFPHVNDVVCTRSFSKFPILHMRKFPPDFFSSTYMLPNPKRNVALQPFINVKTILFVSGTTERRSVERLCFADINSGSWLLQKNCDESGLLIFNSLPYWSVIQGASLLAGTAIHVAQHPTLIGWARMEPPGAASPWGGQGRSCPMADRVSQPCWARASRGENSW